MTAIVLPLISAKERTFDVRKTILPVASTTMARAKSASLRPAVETVFVEMLADASARYDKPDVFNTDPGAPFTGQAFTGQAFTGQAFTGQACRQRHCDQHGRHRTTGLPPAKYDGCRILRAGGSIRRHANILSIEMLIRSCKMLPAVALW
jgi:hypothetical protein